MYSNNSWTEDDLEKKYLNSSVFNFTTTKALFKDGEYRPNINCSTLNQNACIPIKNRVE